MKLSKNFFIDSNEHWVKKHNQQVRKVVNAYNNDCPVRVPLLLYEWPGQHGFFCEENNISYNNYYKDPNVMAYVQLEAARRRRELPIYDMILGEAPEVWNIAVDFWPIVAAGWIGCELLYRDDSVIANHSLRLGKKECDKLKMPDVKNGGILEIMSRYWKYLCEKYEGKVNYLGKPVKVNHGVDTNGFFSLVLDIRGEDIMLDMYEDPEFAHRFLRKIAIWCDNLTTTWNKLINKKTDLFPLSDHGIDMLSPQLYEEFIIPVILEMNKGRKLPEMLHHCGKGIHLFSVMKKYFNIKYVDSITQGYIDLERARSVLGEETWISAVVNSTLCANGSAEQVRQAVKELLTPKAKGKGRLSLKIGDMTKGIPLGNYHVLYKAVKEFGQYGRC